ncbi:hypothetical protein [Methylobacterium soli]|uniref:Uncharacterized protein n=1 Tax=Methylobacterium soli TaxID=553447 RepID=A0A6L3SWB3_9HYPH|nr:hypothetical protein [Methylobacterium soli]KAB1077911.1 hypothetical protein F6X53_17055 [Methylobacterium soli]GJE41591.1 hypothetical protein AEGHOMDF_0757 [Methylobacterium soli]
MRTLLLIGAAALALAGSGLEAAARGRGGGWGGSVSVRGYVTSRGTYVAPHTRSRPDGILSNNLSNRLDRPVPAGSASYVSLPPPESTEVAGAAPGTATAEKVAKAEPWCPPGRLVGSGAGFCLIN